MKDSPSFTGTLNDSPAAEALRKAIGADPGEEVTFVTPQFTRQRGAPMPGQPPTTLEELRDGGPWKFPSLREAAGVLAKMGATP